MWRASIDMPMGKYYEFRYIIDGRWQTDFHADGNANNSFGSRNSVIDLTLVVALPVSMRHSSQVSDGHVTVAPHLPAPSEIASTPVRARAHMGPDIPRLRPRWLQHRGRVRRSGAVRFKDGWLEEPSVFEPDLTFKS
ncbi:MAG: hypothetical protein IPK16_03450 [Anaerolineales bacterium]|nr:hypothetical protein [Anaerolineales bacterium]